MTNFTITLGMTIVYAILLLVTLCLVDSSSKLTMFGRIFFCVFLSAIELVLVIAVGFMVFSTM